MSSISRIDEGNNCATHAILCDALPFIGRSVTRTCCVAKDSVARSSPPGLRPYCRLGFVSAAFVGLHRRPTADGQFDVLLRGRGPFGLRTEVALSPVVRNQN